MGKARHIDQLGFAFDPPAPATAAAALAGLDARVARMVGEALNSDPRAREVIAAEMSVLLEDEVSRAMLDAWSAPGKGLHNISFARMMAFIAVTKRFDLLDRELRAIGASVVVGEETLTVRVGHLRAQLHKIQGELRAIERIAPEIGKGRDETC